MAREKAKAGSKAISGSIELVGLKDGEEAPALELHALDASGKALASTQVDAQGRFSLPRKDLDAAERVLISPAGHDPTQAEPTAVLAFRARDFHAMLGERATIDLSRRDWGRFLFVTHCVDGSVRRCRPYPWFVRNLLLDASRAGVALSTGALPMAERRETARVEDALIAAPIVRPPYFPRRCERVCDGLVEVYRRRCCCRPLIIDDPRLLELLRQIERIALESRIPEWPVGPGPDPGPEIGIFKHGALDEPSLRAKSDLAQVQALSGQEQVDYVQARSYLRPFWCSCGSAQKVGQGWLRGDGTFGICWREPLRPVLPICHDEYAFVVKQYLGAETIVIYDGLAANQWFDESTGIGLTSYSWRARGCGEVTPPGDGAFALLQDIGDTHSYQLKTPDADGWDSVVAPAYNDGLLNPAASPEEAKGRYKNQNLGGTLKLRYHFSEEMEAIGAVYYRISVVEADGSGKPSGGRKTLGDTLSWLYFEEVGGDIVVQSEGLGPVTVNGEPNLYRIPHRQPGREWQSGQYHGYLPTTRFADARHLVTLEVFDAAGKRLRPNGASGVGNDAGFTFRRWYQETGPTAEVPFAALTHMLWWDNRSAVAHIEDLRANGIASGAQCQFLSGSDGTTFSAGYRAYHPNPMFILDHVMWWRRGLGGPSGTLIRSNENAGQPPAAVAVTNPADGVPPATFHNMLDPETKCSFALNLQVNVKTTDGEGILTGLDGYDQAAFALEQE